MTNIFNKNQKLANYSNQKPYYRLKQSISEFFKTPVRYIAESNKIESAFEKPYLNMEYPQMHLDLPNPDWPIISWPDPPRPIIPPGGPIGGSPDQPCLFCNLVGSGHQDTQCGDPRVGLIHIFALRFCTYFPYTNEDCSLEIIVLAGQIIEELPGALGWNTSRYIKVSPMIKSHVIQAIFIDGTGNICTTEITQRCLVETCCDVLPDGAFDFDRENTPETIAPGDSIEVYVFGGCRPFTFQTESMGYDFGGQTSYETDDRQATLNCASGTCGVNFDVTCDLTVTDACGTVVSAKIRNTAGHWGALTWVCPVGGSPNCNYYTAYEEIVGDKKLRIIYDYGASDICKAIWNPETEEWECKSTCGGLWGTAYCNRTYRETYERLLSNSPIPSWTLLRFSSGYCRECVSCGVGFGDEIRVFCIGYYQWIC